MIFLLFASRDEDSLGISTIGSIDLVIIEKDRDTTGPYISVFTPGLDMNFLKVNIFIEVIFESLICLLQRFDDDIWNFLFFRV